MKYNLWRDTYSGNIVKVPADIIPQFGGWELVGTVEE